jgi:pimeloyl-ACP methyl ester carboxylesterase
MPQGVAAPRLGCLLFNAGVLHRVGPHRLNVKMARALARRGVASIRFDVSGLGDSPVAQDGGRGRGQVVNDMQAAMDHLQQTAGIGRFIVVGVCSGAVNGYELALSDPRVAGLMMFDGFTFPTAKTHVMRRWLRFKATPWMQLLRRIPTSVGRMLVGKPRKPAGLFDADVTPGTPPREEFRRAMDELATRGTSVYIVYSGSFIEEHNYDGQLRDAFRGAPFLESLCYDFMADVDHTLTPLAAQRRLSDAVCAWAARLGEA